MHESTAVATSTTSVVPRALRVLLLLGALVVLWWLALTIAAEAHAAAAHTSGADRRTPHEEAHPPLADMIGGTGQALVKEGVTLSRTTVEQVDTALTRSPTGRVAAPVVRPVLDEVVSPTLDRLAQATDTDEADVASPGDLTTVHPSPSRQAPKPAARADGRTSGGPATRRAHEVAAVPDDTPPRVSLSSPAPAAVSAPGQPFLDEPWNDGTVVDGVASSGAATVGGGGGPALLVSADATAPATATRLNRAQTPSPHLAPPHEPGSTPD